MDVSGYYLGTVVSAATVSTGEDHACAVTSTGAVKCWGDNQYGELGNGTTTNSTVPVAVTGLSSGAATVSAGIIHSCAVTTAGAVKCWGDNQFGDLGDGTTTSSTIPVAVTGLSSGAAGVSAGFVISCAVTTTGAAKCWGHNGYGDLGNRTTTSSTVPVGVTGLGTGVSAISAGIWGACALTTGGAVKCWGGAPLGNGTTTGSLVPVDVVGLGSGVAEESRAWFSCAAITGGAVKCWGGNANGELGDGTTTDSMVPVFVVGLG